MMAALIILGTKGTWRVSGNAVGGKELLFAWAIILAGSRFIVPFFALGFGASGVGEEFSDKTAEFLLTRPRNRSYFVWTSWATGVTQILLLDCTYLIVAFVLLLYRTSTPFSQELMKFTGGLVKSVVPLLILGALIYSMTYLLTALFRNGRNGYLTCVGIVLIYPMLVSWVHSQWNITLPSPNDLFAHSSTGESVAFPIVAALGWTLFTLACPWVAQLYIERIDV